MRLQPGEQVTLTDGKGYFYLAEISVADKKHCLVNILEKQEQPPLWKNHIHVALAPTKNMDRIEWFAEKATEIGMDEFTFLNCRFSERKVIKTERIEKILVSAIKQSLKARLPLLHEMTDFNQFVSQPFAGQKFIAHCYKNQRQELKWNQNMPYLSSKAMATAPSKRDVLDEKRSKSSRTSQYPIARLR